MATSDAPTPALRGDDGALLGGRYRLHESVGHGAMATVYRATDETLGRDVAVKLFLPGSGDDEFRMRQETEMRVLAGFDHPGLVSLYDAGTDNREPDAPRAYLVMELVHGTNLRHRLDSGRLTPADTARIGECLASALIQVHSNDVIHRDIKPANILVPDSITVAAKLADFGVARIVDGSRLTATGMTVGTASYLSPEQAMGRELTPASDIYSLGLVLIECLSGLPEYPGTPMESAAARLHRAPRIPDSLSPAFARLLAEMTDLDPGSRPSATVVAGILGELMASFDASAQAPTSLVPQMPDHAPALGSRTQDDSSATAFLPLGPGAEGQAGDYDGGTRLAGAAADGDADAGSGTFATRRSRRRAEEGARITATADLADVVEEPAQNDAASESGGGRGRRAATPARHPGRRVAVLVALLLAVAVGAPVIAAAIFTAQTPPGTNVTTPTKTPELLSNPMSSPSPSSTSVPTVTPTPATTPVVVPAQEPTTVPDPTSDPATKGPGKGTDNGKGKKPTPTAAP